MISWWLTCGPWRVSDHFLLVSLSAADEGALTSDHTSSQNPHLSPSFHFPHLTLVFYVKDVWKIKICSFICYNSMPGTNNNVPNSFGVKSRTPWEPPGGMEGS